MLSLLSRGEEGLSNVLRHLSHILGSRITNHIPQHLGRSGRCGRVELFPHSTRRFTSFKTLQIYIIQDTSDLTKHSRVDSGESGRHHDKSLVYLLYPTSAILAIVSAIWDSLMRLYAQHWAVLHMPNSAAELQDLQKKPII